MAKKRIQNLLKHVVCILLCLCVVLPFYMVLINSFKTKAEAARMSLALPTEWVFSNYSEVIEKGSLILLQHLALYFAPWLHLLCAVREQN